MSGPVRTCVGCRGRAAKSDLLRIVRQPTSLAVDPRQREPGRGAYLHPDARCLELAVRRRAVGRALKTTAVDLAQLEEAVSPWLTPGPDSGGAGTA